jgi:hypothetical protein
MKSFGVRSTPRIRDFGVFLPKFARHDLTIKLVIVTHATDKECSLSPN